MDTRAVLRLELAYDQGLYLRVLTPGTQNPAVGSPVAKVLEQIASLGWMPVLERIPVILEMVASSGLHLQVAPDVKALATLADRFVDQDEARERWLKGNELSPLRAQLSPLQLQGAAYMAFRQRVLLADARALEPHLTTLAAAEILRSQQGGLHTVIISPSSRHHLWRETLQRLSGLVTHEVELESGTKPLYVLLDEESAFRQRAELDALKPGLLILDEASRHWSPGNRVLDTVRRLQPAQLFVLTHADPKIDPEGLYALVSLMYPLLAGPRPQWESRYLDRSERSNPVNINSKELETRLTHVLLARPLSAMGEPQPEITEVRLVPLSKNQRTQYDRLMKNVFAGLEKANPNGLESRNTEETFHQARLTTASLALYHEKLKDSSKLDELKELLRLDLAAGRRMVIFSRWEKMTSQVSALLDRLHIKHLRLHRRVTSKKREELFERWKQDPQIQVLVNSDMPMPEVLTGISLLVHLDVPWNPAVITWRRSMALGNGREELAFVAEDTLEEPLWKQPRPATAGVEVAGEEEDGTPHVRLYAQGRANAQRLAQLLEMQTELNHERAAAKKAGTLAPSAPVMPEQAAADKAAADKAAADKAAADKAAAEKAAAEKAAADKAASDKAAADKAASGKNVVDSEVKALRSAEKEDLLNRRRVWLEKARAARSEKAAQRRAASAQALAEIAAEQAAADKAAAEQAAADKAAAEQAAADKAAAEQAAADKAAAEQAAAEQAAADKAAADKAAADKAAADKAAAEQAAADKAAADKAAAEKAAAEKAAADKAAADKAAADKAAADKAAAEQAAADKAAADKAAAEQAAADKAAADKAAADKAAADKAAADKAAAEQAAADNAEAEKARQQSLPTDRLSLVLNDIEVPLKAFNRILAGVPVVGEQVSQLNATLWELVTSPLRKR
ncbi:MAG: helicase-related protein [Myxococcota bacterium]